MNPSNIYSQLQLSKNYKIG